MLSALKEQGTVRHIVCEMQWHCKNALDKGDIGSIDDIF